MSIWNAASAKTIKAAMFEYLGASFSVIPLKGKLAATGWTLYQTQRPISTDIMYWESMGWLNGNIGVVCGRVSGNLIVIDLDGQLAIERFKANFPMMLETFTIRTGSGGLHVYLQVDDLPRNRKVSFGEGHSGIEIRGNGQYVVAPPSIHPTTQKAYRIESEREIQRVYDLKAVETWLDTQSKPAAAPSAATKSRPAATKTGVALGFEHIRYPQLWTNAAVSREMEAVARSHEGRRNDQLYSSAYNLGQIVAIGWLTSNNAERALLDAAKAAGLPESEALNTIQSGLQTGSEAPRDVQWQKRGK